MKTITHRAQQKAWDAEHKKPKVLKQMDSDEASSGVQRFLEFLKKKKAPAGSGLEMGCGKGRNVIWLAKQGAAMTGFDFAPSAIKEAKRRAQGTGAKFLVADATKKWPFKTGTFDFGIDCFASTDIESQKGRKLAMREMMRVLKPGGYFLAYLLSTDDEFHKEMIKASPSKERNAFLHPTGKFEKVYDANDIRETFTGWKVVRSERVKKTATFGDREYACNHYWLLFTKPEKPGK